MNCKDATDLMQECVTGTTLPDRRLALATHLQECSICRREAEQMEELVQMLRVVPEARLPEGYWSEFMAALDQRLLQDTTGWRRLVRLLVKPRMAWSAVAATAVLVVGLGFAILLQPFGQSDRSAESQTEAELRGFVTESVQRSLPSADVIVSWKAGLSTPDVSYELVTSGGR